MLHDHGPVIKQGKRWPSNRFDESVERTKIVRCPRPSSGWTTWLGLALTTARCAPERADGAFAAFFCRYGEPILRRCYRAAVAARHLTGCPHGRGAE
jgi:hypothetical protein